MACVESNQVSSFRACITSVKLTTYSRKMDFSPSKFQSFIVHEKVILLFFFVELLLIRKEYK